MPGSRESRRAKRPQARKLPKQARSVALVDAIVVAAREQLEERGPGFTLADVAQRAGVSPGSLYQYFPERLSLIGAIIDAQIEQDRRLLAEFEGKLHERERADVPALVVDGILLLYGERPRLMVQMVHLMNEVGRLDDLRQLTDRFVEVLAGLLGGLEQGGSGERHLEGARLCVSSLLGAAREVAQSAPEQLGSPEFRSRLLLIARAALGG